MWGERRPPGRASREAAPAAILVAVWRQQLLDGEATLYIANTRRLVASTPAMTAEAALRVAEAAELVKVGGRPRVQWQRQGGVREGCTARGCGPARTHTHT